MSEFELCSVVLYVVLDPAVQYSDIIYISEDDMGLTALFEEISDTDNEVGLCSAERTEKSQHDVDLPSSMPPSKKIVRFDNSRNDSDHSYAFNKREKHEDVSSKKRMQAESELTHVSEIDHDYVKSKPMSDTYTVGQNLALDLAVTITRKYRSWCEASSNYTGCSNRKMENELQRLLSTFDINDLVTSLLKYDDIRSIIVHNIMKLIQTDMSELRHRKLSYVSNLMNKSFDSMSQLSWESIVCEVIEKVPLLFNCLIAALLPREKMSNPAVLSNIVPRLGFIYSLTAFSYNHELSVVNAFCRYCCTIVIATEWYVALHN